jgi:hypothetical protein
VNEWFRQNKKLIVSDLTLLARDDAMHSDPDGNWYTEEGKPAPNRPSLGQPDKETFWRASEPLFDFLHEQYRVAWTYTVLMLQPSKQFRGTPTNLGVGDHFTAREDVVFQKKGRSRTARIGWHANQFPPFLVQQQLHEEPPFELISTYALNILHLRDALPLIITRSADDAKNHEQRRAISVSRFDELFANALPKITKLVDKMGPCYRPGLGWGHGGKNKLAPHFNLIDERAIAVLRQTDDDMFRVLEAGPDPDGASTMVARLRRGKAQKNLALAKYLILMTAVWPDWTRITMIPHRVPIFADPQPGGIVICEDTRSKNIPADELGRIGDLLSTSIWPWVSLLNEKRGEKRGEFEAAVTNAALLGKAVRHDLNNSLSPIRSILSDPYNRSHTSEDDYNSMLSALDVVRCSVDGLSGLEDSPEEPKTVAFWDLCQRLQDAFRYYKPVGAIGPVGEIDIKTPSNFNAQLPRLYYAVFAELLRNAGKYRDDNRRCIEMRACQAERLIKIQVTNVGTRTKVTEAAQNIRAEVEKLRDTSIAATESAGEGIGLVVTLTKRAGGEIGARAESDTNDRGLLIVEVTIPGVES